MICIYLKHMKIGLRTGGKVYRALVRYRGQTRISRRDFGKAGQAAIYGRKWAKRASRLLVARRDGHA